MSKTSFIRINLGASALSLEASFIYMDCQNPGFNISSTPSCNNNFVPRQSPTTHEDPSPSHHFHPRNSRPDLNEAPERLSIWISEIGLRSPWFIARFVNFSLLSHVAMQLLDKMPRNTHVKGSVPYPRALMRKTSLCVVFLLFIAILSQVFCVLVHHPNRKQEN